MLLAENNFNTELTKEEIEAIFAKYTKNFHGFFCDKEKEVKKEKEEEEEN